MNSLAAAAKLAANAPAGRARELALTARVFKAQEAKAIGLVTEVFPDPAALHAAVASTAASMAAKSPLAITGSKRVLLHSRHAPFFNWRPINP
jgi:enoyl-CoA hydratase/carnithine racemase